jgi:hypothetical protein
MEISTDERFAFVLPIIKQKIKASQKTAARITKTKNRSILRIDPTADGDDILFGILCKIIVTELKIYYIRTHARIPNMNTINSAAFIKALATYDAKTDMIIASAIVKITPHIHLDSLYDFRLSPLHKRWADVTALINDNINNLTCPSMFNELLRFLIANLEYKNKEAHIVKNGRRIQICDDNLTPFENTAFDNIGIISALIDISPKTVFIHSGNNEIDYTLIKNIEAIFPNCVRINYTTIT